MPDQNFDAPEISPFKRDQLNPFYLLAKLLYTEPGKNTYIRKKIAKEIIEILKEEYHIGIDEEIDSIIICFGVLIVIKILKNKG